MAALVGVVAFVTVIAAVGAMIRLIVGHRLDDGEQPFWYWRRRAGVE